MCDRKTRGACGGGGGEFNQTNEAKEEAKSNEHLKSVRLICLQRVSQIREASQLLLLLLLQIVLLLLLLQSVRLICHQRVGQRRDPVDSCRVLG